MSAFIDVFVREYEFHIIEGFRGEEDQIFQFKVFLAISKSWREGRTKIVIRTCNIKFWLLH